MKDFVRKHPDNKMGWYLLGKVYADQGKEGKANYCFAKAGEVYEAFEKKPVPVELPKEEEDILEDQLPVKRVRSAYYARFLTASAILLLLLAFPSVPVKDTTKDKTDPKAETTVATQPLIPENEINVFYTQAVHKAGELNQALKEIVFPETQKTKYSVIAKAPESADGKWILWWKDPAVLLSAERQDDSGKIDVAYHDAETCLCKPADAAKAQQTTASWMRQQEQMAVLRSAAAAFRQMNGGLPGQPEELAKPFPHNVLPGLTDSMRQAYPAMAAALVKSPPLKDGNAPAATGANEQSPAQPGVPQADSTSVGQPLKAPLEIIVDKETHRLALVSGKAIVRSYPVGLGGDRTPEREFTISEKVRNPKGKKGGEFGTRGMQLSDTDYAIHGTTQPESVGLDRSLGCVRMLQEDLEELYDMTPLGTKVTIRKGGLPVDTGKPPRFKLVPLGDDTNPGKIYKWLN